MHGVAIANESFVECNFKCGSWNFSHGAKNLGMQKNLIFENAFIKGAKNGLPEGSLQGCGYQK